MKRYLGFAWSHPYLVAALVVVLFLPWLWMAFLLPHWALFTALALVPVAALVAIALVVKDLNADDEGGDITEDEEPFRKWRKRTRLFQQVVVGLDTQLERWDGTAEAQRGRLDALGGQVQEVVRLTEQAVGEIGKRFREVVAKAHQQTEAATSILRADEAGPGRLTLPDFIRAYDAQLVNVTSHMTGFSEAAEEMASHQKRVTEHALVMEQTIDGLRNMASQISRIALDGSVAMTSQTLNPRDFVEMTDRIRAISAEAHELTRRTRQGLDAIGDEVRQGNKRTTQVAQDARRAVELARAEISSLNAATIAQTGQIEAALKRINDLSGDIRRDIDQIIVAMQFQDITRQMLEREHKPALASVSEALAQLSHETRALRGRDLYRAVRAYAQSALKPRMGMRDPDEGGGDRDGGTPAATPAQAPPADKRVELF